MQKQRWWKILKLVLKAGVTILALWFVFSRIPLHDVAKEAGKASVGWLIIATLLFILSKFFSALRLNVFFQAAGIRISHAINLRLYLLGMFYNLSLPGGIGGDGYKLYWIKKHTGQEIKRIFWSLMSDRLSGLLALFVLAISGIYLTPLSGQGFATWIWLLIPLSGVTALLLLKKFLPYFAPVFARTSLLSLGVQLSQVLSAMALLMALQVEHHFASYIFLFLVSSIAASLPITIGGAGSREIVFVLGAEWLHLDTSISLTISLLFFSITVLVSLTGLYLMLRPGKLSYEADALHP